MGTEEGNQLDGDSLKAVSRWNLRPGSKNPSLSGFLGRSFCRLVVVGKGSSKSAAFNPQATHQSVNELVYRFLHDRGATTRAADRQVLINVVASEQHITKIQAVRTVNGWAQEPRAAQAQVGAAANAAGQTARLLFAFQRAAPAKALTLARAHR